MATDKRQWQNGYSYGKMAASWAKHFSGRSSIGMTVLSSVDRGAFSHKVYCVSPWTIESQDFQLMLILKF